METDYKYLLVDLFAGAGGVSSGAARAKHKVYDEEGNLVDQKLVKVIVAVNHDEIAIESHHENHPEVFHFIEDVRSLDFEHLASIVKMEREKHPDAKLVLWASAECTHFSNAKGGPKDEGSRSLAWIIPQYQRAIDPDYIFVENVKEFMNWGPVDENNYPIQELKGQTYTEWRDTLIWQGYNYSYVVDDAADFSAFTSRVRYFGAFYRPNLPFTHPKQTHSKNGENGLPKWNAVGEVLDLDDHGKSIFSLTKTGRKRSDKTFRRVLIGCKKFVPNFLIQYNGQSTAHKIDKPIGTLTQKDRFAKVSLQMLDKQYGTGVPQSIDKPAGTITTSPKLHLATIQMMDQQYGNSKPKPITGPVNTLTANPKQNLISVQMMDQNYGQSTPKPLDGPIGTLMTKEKHSLVTAQFMDNPQWGGNPWSIERPSFTLVARMDKAPPSLVTTIPGNDNIVLSDEDGPYERELKLFMIEHGIVDIKMRMLHIPEMLQIMGFGRDYKLKGTMMDQKRFIGNAVVCDYVQKWFEDLATVDVEADVKVKVA